MKHAIATLLLIFGSITAAAQSPHITQIDPPNWWAQMPKPMLLVNGEGFTGAAFSISDKSLRIERTQVSANGHYAFLWLSASPAKPETVTLKVSAHGTTAQAPYTFAERRKPGDGFAGFNSSDVMYLIMIDRFANGDPGNDGPLAHSAADSPEAAAERAKSRGWHGGDIRGMMQHIDYLQKLGVTTVWPTPVYENHRFDSYHGYGATDMYRVDEHYGTLADLQAFSAALHARHMKLVLDEVPNHVGPTHPWVTDSPMPDWFHGTAANHLPGDSNFVGLVDPHTPKRDTLNTTDGWFVGLLPDMNTENPAVETYLRQNVIWWVEQTGADGIRIDTFPYINREFWKNYLGALHQLYPHITEVGEAKSTEPIFTSSYAGGVTRVGVDTTLWTPFDFPLDGALHKAFAEGGPLTGISAVLALDPLYPHPERLVTVLDNHDEPRFRSEAKSLAAMHMALAVLLTTRGLPQLYSGDELAMRGGEDPDNRHDFPGGFSSTGPNAFTRTGLSDEERATNDWVSKLALLRQSHPALTCGGQQQLLGDANTLVYVRDSSKGCDAAVHAERIVVAIHRGDAKQVDLNLHQTWLEACSALTPLVNAEGVVQTVGKDNVRLALGSNSTAILRCSDTQPLK